MLNDVHAPPVEPKPTAAKPVHPPRDDRAHALERTADHGMGTDLVFSDPEDRGDAFNTTMSAIIVGGVLIALIVVAWVLWT